jgi:hypothetical protein
MEETNLWYIFYPDQHELLILTPKMLARCVFSRLDVHHLWPMFIVEPPRYSQFYTAHRNFDFCSTFEYLNTCRQLELNPRYHVLLTHPEYNARFTCDRIDHY